MSALVLDDVELADALDAAADLLVLWPHVWTQGAYARGATGFELNRVDGNLCQVCAIGATALALGAGSGDEAWRLLEFSGANPRHISSANDQEGRLAAVVELRAAACGLRGGRRP